MYKACLFLVLSLPLLGQHNGVLGGPVSGYIGDTPTRSIRPIIGVLGGAYLGKAILEEVDQAWVAPTGDRALILRGDRYFLVSDLDTSALRIDQTPITVSGAHASVAWAADGSMVVVAGNGDLQAATWKTHEGAWTVDPVRVIPSGAITAVAVDSQFGAVAVAISHGHETNVHVGSLSGGELDVFYNGKAVSALAYAPAGTALYVSDKGTGQILAITRSGARGEGLITSDPEEYTDVISLLVADNGNAVYSVHHNRRVVVKHNIADHSVRVVDLEGTPNGIINIMTAGFYVVAVREKISDAVLAVDSQSCTHYFIPAGGVQ